MRRGSPQRYQHHQHSAQRHWIRIIPEHNFARRPQARRRHQMARQTGYFGTYSSATD